MRNLMKTKSKGCLNDRVRNSFQLKVLLMKDKNFMKINIPGKIFSMVVNISAHRMYLTIGI